MAKTIIRVANPDLHNSQETTLTQDVAVGGTTLTVAATTGFGAISGASDYYYLLIGRYGQENAEIVLASAKTDSTFTVGALKYSHSSSDVVTLIPYNQAKFYGRLTTGGSSNLLATVDIDCSQQFTSYVYTASVYAFFVTSYYRSATTAEESDVSDEISYTTFSPRSVKNIIEAGVKKALTRVDENPDASLGWNNLISLVNEGLMEIATRKKQWQCLHKIDSTQTTTADVAYIDKPTDLSVMEFMMVDGGKVDFITKMRYNQLTTGTTTTTGTPYHYTIKNDQIYLYPTPSQAFPVTFEYFSIPTEVTGLTDEVKNEFVTILIYFVAAQAAYARNNEKRGDKMEMKFQQVLAMQIEDVTGYEQVGDAQESERTSIYGMTDFEDII